MATLRPPRFRSAREAETFVLGFINYELRTDYRRDTRTHDLDRFRERLLRAGWRPGSVPTVHVAGTNGKGSVSVLTESVLRAGGLRTGLYTSPHLRSLRERIRIEGRPIAAAVFRRGVERLARVYDAQPGDGFRTTFEYLTGLAFLVFQDAALDRAVVEVGLGGRLDATNILPPGPVVFTPVALDHEEILGRGVEAIADDKARILKPGGRAFLLPQIPAVRRRLEARAREVDAGITDVLDAIAVRTERVRRTGLDLAVTGGLDYGTVRTRLLGDHQRGNVAAAVAVAEALLPETACRGAVRAGLSGAVVPGRLDRRRWRGVAVLVDGGHNPAAGEAVARAMALHFPGVRAAAVVGMPRDKDHRGYLEALAPVVERFVFTRAASPRAADPEDLAAVCPRPGSWIEPDPRRALTLAAEPPTALILAGGSFVVAGEMLRVLDS